MAVAAAGLCLTILRSGFPAIVSLTATYTLPFLLVVAVAIAVSLLRKGSTPIHRGLVIAGTFLIVGGATFDMVATVIHSPRLRLEGNAVVRLLLASNHSVSEVYIYAIIVQSQSMALDVLLWCSLIRHRTSLVESLNAPEDFKHFFKAVTGGANLTWRQWSSSIRIRDQPQIYPLFWLFVVMLVATSFDRWYLGLEWFKVIRGHRTLVVCVSLAFSILCFYFWLWKETQMHRT